MSNIFLKKRKNINNLSKYKIISINKNKKINDRHFPPASTEWSNSIYAFNKNNIKILPRFEKMVTKLIKSYFYLHHVKNKSKEIPRIRRLRIRLRRLSINRIFVSKAEIKHTNTKAIITVYIYNAEKRYLLNKLKKRNPMLTLSNERLGKKIKIVKIKALKVIKLTKKIFLNLNLNLKKTIKSNNNNKEKKTKKSSNILYDYSVTQQYKKFLKKSLRKERYSIYYKYLFWLNKSKFKNTFINPFNKLLCSFLDKKLELNLINLKYLYLNSNILSQLLTIKLKNRKNRLLRVLNVFFRKVKIPYFKKFSERFTILDKAEKRFLLNKVKSLSNLNNVLFKTSNKKKKNDLLNQTLQNIFIKNKQKPQKENYIENTILNTIKQKTILGVRIEASGRLTRRLIAARSIFKLRYKGTLKNIDSSYKGLSTVMLRNHLKSNIQYTKISSKTRNGSFGLKGWINTM